MMFTYREFDKVKDVELLNKLLEKRGLPSAELTFLPPTGVVVMQEANPICLGFMIRCDNGMVINSDLISDIDVPKGIRNAAVKYMREVLYDIAKSQGYQFVTIFTKIPRLEKKLKEEMGYVDIDSNLKQLGRFLWLSRG